MTEQQIADRVWNLTCVLLYLSKDDVLKIIDKHINVLFDATDIEFTILVLKDALELSKVKYKL